MKFVYFGYDFMLESVQRLLSEGHELLAVFSFDCDNVFNFNVKTKELAERLDIPFSTNKPLPMDIGIFCDQGAQVFLSAGYPHKIPPVDEDRAYGINFHPSLLPAGRGIMPTPTILMNHPEASGVTIHKLSDVFDDGDILLQKKIPITAQDDVETLSCKIAMAAPDMLSRVFRELPALWQSAAPQDQSKASTFPMPDEAMRMLDWLPARLLLVTFSVLGDFEHTRRALTTEAFDQTTSTDALLAIGIERAWRVETEGQDEAESTVLAVEATQKAINLSTAVWVAVVSVIALF